MESVTYSFVPAAGCNIEVKPVDWSEAEAELRSLRTRVFIEEQRVPEALEWDGLDGRCRHVLALSPSGQAVGCGRLTPERQIGRMAVLPAWRGRGIGSLLLKKLLRLACEEKMPRVFLNAQVHAIPFYERHGFSARGPVFDDAGIAHRRMERVLDC
jgi:predicted GNAT family N-acyltransferase